MYRDKTKFYLLAAFLTFMFVAFVVVRPAAYWMSERTEVVTINDKERINDADSSKYLVFTDRGVYEVTDSLLYFAFDSSDRYAEMVRGQSYTVTVAGWRFPFLSWYPNIVEVNYNN